MKTLTITLVILLLQISVSKAFLSWLFGGQEEQLAKDDSAGDKSAVTVGRVPFEMKSADEKFLGTGKELMAGLSELDVCHHTVIYQLKASCNEMSEEELAKLGVKLLNCQSAAEGRPIFKCSDDMTVADCTKSMDPNTWNAYHIVSNRARSVCYAVRQQQFQRQTQFAVNQLAMSAEGQLHLMEHLRNGQEDLNSMATDALHTISAGQEKLVQTQEMIGSSQSRLKLTVESNIRDLTREKALISAGHQELAAMTDEIRRQLDAATHQLLEQDIDKANKHQEVLEDLASLSLLAKDMWNTLDHNMHHMQSYQVETAQHYQQTLENLKRMNQTISYLLEVTQGMQTEISQQLGWVTKLLTWTSENMAVLVTCTLHTGYFFLAGILCSFLNTPVFSRVVLLLVVPLNAAAEVRQGTSLNFPSLSFFITSVVFANWIALWISYRKERGQIVEAASPRTLYLPDFSHIHGSPIRDITYEPSAFSSESGGSGSSTNHRLHSTGYASILTDTSRNVTSLLMSSARKASLSEHRVTDVGDSTGVESDIFSSDNDDDDDDTPTQNSTGRTLTVTNLSINVDHTLDPTPMPTDHSASSATVSTMRASEFGTITTAAARRQLGVALDQVQAATTPRPRGAGDATPRGTPKGTPRGTPSSSRSSSPSRRPCRGQTKAGLPCRLPCTAGKDFCYRHANPQTSAANTPAKND